MKRFFSFSLAVLFCATALFAGQVTSFPRKFLLEQFTGEACGFCPYGMDCIYAFDSINAGKYVWIAHHYGYGTDEYTIAANSQVGQKMAVSGAPNAVINRTKRVVNGTNAYAFHPGYFEENAVPVKDADISLVSVEISHSYEPATRTLKVYVHGQSLDASATKYKVCVYIKESGTLGEQHDYDKTWEGWQSFRHTKTVRASLTNNALGASVDVANGAYALDTITYSIPASWNDSNCCIVAAVTKGGLTTDYTILNCEQTPLVAGTDGGESIKHGGITQVPVADSYPEVGTPRTDIVFTQKNYYTDNISKGYGVLTLMSSSSFTYDGMSCMPYLQLYVLTNSSTLAAGSYTISSTGNFGTVYAGYKDVDAFEVGGSMFYYVYTYNGSLYPATKWLLTSGQLQVNADGSMEITAKTLNGSNFHGVYNMSTAIGDVESASKPTKYFENGHLRIVNGANTFDAAGQMIK